MPFATALPYVNELTELTSSPKSNGSEARLILPLSILATSKTSLMSDSRKRDDKAILFRHSLSRSGLPTFMPAMAVIPMIAFIGVLMSCDIRERNSLLAWLACSAATSAIRNVAFWRSSSSMSLAQKRSTRLTGSKRYARKQCHRACPLPMSTRYLSSWDNPGVPFSQARRSGLKKAR